MTQMSVRVLYFGLIRECCDNVREDKVEVPVGATVDDLVAGLVDRYPALDRYRNRVQMAVNESIVRCSTVLADGDTVAFIPQVAGGSDRYCRLTDQPLSVDELLAAVTAPGQGGVVVFIGNVRDHNQGHSVTHLHYEAYPAMVYRTLESIIERCEAIGEGVQVAVAHRTGDLQIGDSAVIIAAAAPHRAEAFQAARMCIEYLKEETPIWKKEFSPDGAEWIGTRP
ncbi:Molybdopterin synthase catalytic subunit 1 [Mycobacterium basiliense]|uniref:Molybdopterin synthase catalytic subunit 1 n=2 Tax=Mycobacterium basiliense TaxID=2094119 RepID=A0A3S4BBA5_9MYCO|nr:molybdenum cofactor biosynthesis protein MoaE [Mycobacterium basiliense]VDM86566.1 Molybdopterin synthase catalytic subunit 1 [Mycobacterium basiliense]